LVRANAAIDAPLWLREYAIGEAEIAAQEQRAREMRLYAARLEVLDGRNLGRWKAAEK
jgi:hypothetical protein